MKVISFLRGKVHAYKLVEKHQFSFTYLRVNNGINYFPRCDISQLLIFLTLCSI